MKYMIYSYDIYDKSYLFRKLESKKTIREDFKFRFFKMDIFSENLKCLFTFM